MGSIRFIWGVIREGELTGSLELRASADGEPVTLYHQCPAEVSIKVVEDNRPKIVKTYNSERDAAMRQPPPWENAEESEDVGLPPLQYPTADSESGWIAFDKPILSVTAGQGPFMSP
jgi:sphingosine kinase